MARSRASQRYPHEWPDAWQACAAHTAGRPRVGDQEWARHLAGRTGAAHPLKRESMTVDLTELAYFQAAGKHEHFTRAAETAHVAQPALSRQIHALETELGLRLFDRVGRGVKLTAAGRTILPHVERILAEVNGIRADARMLSNLEGGTVALGFLHSIGAHLLPAMLATFRARHPHVGFTLHEGPWSELEERVLHGDLDLAITSPLPEAGTDLSAIQLLRDDLLAALPPHHRRASCGLVA